LKKGRAALLRIWWRKSHEKSSMAPTRSIKWGRKTTLTGSVPLKWVEVTNKRESGLEAGKKIKTDEREPEKTPVGVPVWKKVSIGEEP